MSLFVAEIIDKIGSGYEPAACSCLFVLILSALAGPWRWWLPALLSAPIAIWGSYELLAEIQDPWGQEIIASVGMDHYVRQLISWNAPFLLSPPAGRLIHRIAPALRHKREGMCPRCEYDLRGDLALGCPECGWGRAVSRVSD